MGVNLALAVGGAMSHRIHAIRFALLASITAFALSAAAQGRGSAGDDALVALEQRKWNPKGFSSREEFVALFADDFVSVGDGIDISGGVQRKTRAEVFGGPPHPTATFELSEFKVVHPNSDAAIVSYRVTGTSFAWKAYVTSVWARRQGKWTTVFYQASPAR